MYNAIIYDVNLSDFDEYPPSQYEVYDTIEELKITDESNIVDLTIPIATATFKLITDGVIRNGAWCEIRSGNIPTDDNLDDLWFRGIISEAIEENGEWNIVVESLLAKLDERDTAAKMYENDNVIPELRRLFGDVPFDIYPAFERNYLKGYCEEETCRERLQKILYAEGFYIRQTFVLYPEIRDGWYYARGPINSAELIPLDRVYWTPKVSDNTRWDRLIIYEYQYTQGTPSQGDQTVTDGNETWIVEKVPHNYYNNPYSVHNGKDVTVDLSLVTDENIYDIVVDISESNFFSAGSMSCEVLAGDCENCPKVGDKVFIPACPFVDIPRLYSGVLGVVGFVNKEEIAFGNNAKASIIISGCNIVNTKKLTISYIAPDFDDTLIRVDSYHFPVGYEYKIKPPKMYIEYNGQRYELNAQDDYVEGEMPSQNTSITVNVYSEEE